MWIYKSCPKCRGDFFIDEDGAGRYVKCLQCGYEKELPRRKLKATKMDYCVSTSNTK